MIRVESGWDQGGGTGWDDQGGIREGSGWRTGRDRARIKTGSGRDQTRINLGSGRDQAGNSGITVTVKPPKGVCSWENLAGRVRRSLPERA